MSTERLKATSTDHLAGAPFNPRQSDAITLGSGRSGAITALRQSCVGGRRKGLPHTIPMRHPTTCRPQHPPQTHSSRSPPPRTPPERSVSPIKSTMNPSPIQPAYTPPQSSFSTQQRHELFDATAPHHQQDSTVGSYRTAYGGCWDGVYVWLGCITCLCRGRTQFWISFTSFIP